MGVTSSNFPANMWPYWDTFGCTGWGKWNGKNLAAFVSTKTVVPNMQASIYLSLGVQWPFGGKTICKTALWEFSVTALLN